MKKSTWFLMITVGWLLAVGCSGKKDGIEMVQQQQQLKIGVSFQEMNNPYFVVMREAAEDVAGTLNAQLFMSDAQHDIVKQIADVEDMIQKGIDILIINPTDSSGIRKAVEAADKAGVIVVAVDAEAEGPIASFVGSGNYNAGLLAGRSMAEKLNGKGKVAIIDGIPVVPILQRVAGFKDAIANYPDIEIVSILNGKQNRDEALTVMENIISAQPDLNGVFTVNDEGSLGAYSAIMASGKEIYLTSVDGNPEAVKAVGENGLFISTVGQKPRDMIKMGIAIALAKYWGTTAIPRKINTEIVLINPSNAAAFSW